MADFRSKTWKLACLALLAAGAGQGWAQAADAAHASAMRVSRAFSSHVVIPQARAIALAERPSGVRLTEVRAAVSILEQVAATTLEISLENPGPARLEAEMLVPVPEKAAVRSFAYDGVGGEPTAELLPRDEARRIYDSIVAKSRDPALLEFIGYNLIRSSVFPVEPNGKQKVRLTYEQLLPSDAGRVDYVLPRSESLEYSVPWHIAVEIKSKHPVSTVYSPSHRLEVQRRDPHTIAARTADEAAGDPGAFRLCYLPESDGLTASLLAYPDPKIGGGYFLLLAGLPTKPEEEPGAQPIKREITLVLDRSGSMNGEKIQQVRDAALQVVEGLEPGEFFNIFPYNESVDSFAEAPVLNSTESLARARKYIETIQARGGTNIHDALLEALRQKPTPGTLPLTLFLTDGLPTVGNTFERDIRDLAVKANQYKRRLFTFGVGVDVNTPLLDKLADLTRATATFVLPKEDVEAKVGQVFRRLSGPVLADPELAVLGPDGKPAPGRTRDLLPKRLPDLFEGDQLVLLGQYLSEEPLSCQLSGNYLGRKRTFRFTFALDKATVRNGFVPRLWASRKIGVLIDAIRSLGADQPFQQPKPLDQSDPRVKELVSEVVRLSQEFGILTEYTAFLAREGGDLSDVRGNWERANRRFVARAQNKRAGWDSVSQEGNLGFYRNQSLANPTNSLVIGKNNLQAVQFANVQQFNDRAFFNNDGRWVEGRAAVKARQEQPKKTIEFGSEEFLALAHKLAAEERQSSISLRGEILLEVDNELVLVRNPVVAADQERVAGESDHLKYRRDETPDAKWTAAE